MDWNKHETFQHLTPQQVQFKIDELNKTYSYSPVIPVLKKDMDINSLYSLEVWFHFNSNTLVAMIYKDPIFDENE